MTRIIPARFESLGTLKRNSSFPTEPHTNTVTIHNQPLLMIACVHLPYREKLDVLVGKGWFVASASPVSTSSVPCW